ncbi:unnamed protein product [Tuber aestivum]|uniref:Uncharacterized protein n=1 Tax=Tuber aestivum TaxID=59557 RepID=A0A292PZU8_9PEZI|nr:unnamed protein product [Tuber aestivum]
MDQNTESTIGVAVLSGILPSFNGLHLPSASGTSTPAVTLLQTRFHQASKTPAYFPSRFIACVERPEAASRVCCAFEGFTSPPVEIYMGCNGEGMWRADLVILGCNLQIYAEMLGEEGMCEALKG